MVARINEQPELFLTRRRDAINRVSTGAMCHAVVELRRSDDATPSVGNERLLYYRFSAYPFMNYEL